MRTNQEGPEVHGMQELDGAMSSPEGRLQSFKGYLEVEGERLHARHDFGLGGKEIAQGRSHLVDAVVQRACRMVAEDLGPRARADLAASAVVALGGYGRQELAPASDVDLLFLHPDRVSESTTDFVEAILPLLWDIGLKIGHSVRSVPDCVELGTEDLHSRNAMSEARLVVGNAEIFQRLQRELFARVYQNPRANRRFFKMMKAEFDERRARYGPVVGMLEPHLKEGAGGLRDLHTVTWVGLARYGSRGLHELLDERHVTPEDYERVVRAYDFLLRVRNEAHYQTKRVSDFLTLDLQPSIARALGYEDGEAVTASEGFMRDFYFRAQEIQRFADAFLRKADFNNGQSRRFPLPSRTRAVGPERRYRIRGDRLYVGPRGRLGGGPLRLFEVFAVAQKHRVRVSAELKQAVHERAHTVDDAVRESPEVAGTFMAIMGDVGHVSTTLSEMHETGLLGRYLPEFGDLTFMPQHDSYHRFTVDQHTLRALEGLDELVDGARVELAPLRDALQQVAHPAHLTLALLLHDVGKGRGGGHTAKGAALAVDVCSRLGLGQDATDDVIFLVAKHLVMSRVSQRRDLSDHALLGGFAETVGSSDRLNMLYLLTYADLYGVGPGVWNEWKGALLVDLRAKTLATLAGERAVAAGPSSRAQLEDRVLEDLLPEFLRSDVDEFLLHLPDRYMLAMTTELIARHFEMIHELGSHTVITDWRPSTKGPYTLLSVCLRDRPGVLASIAGALTGAGLDILSVDIFTRDDGIVLDLFKVCEAMATKAVQPVAAVRFGEIDEALVAALEGRVDLADAVERQRIRQARKRRVGRATPPAVNFELSHDGTSTVVEVRADDEVGLVYRLAATLSRLGLDISFAKIATEKHQALDVFYVTNESGSALSAGEQAAVEGALTEMLASGS